MTQLSLFPQDVGVLNKPENLDWLSLIKKRPQITDLIVINEIAKNIAPKVLDWAKEPISELESIEKDLIKALKFTELEGYQIARELENIGYDVDSSLVELCDNAYFIGARVRDKFCRTWIKFQNIKSPVLGAKVKFKYHGNWYIGEITSNTEEGTSIVFCEELGHVRNGLGTHGVYYNWEDLTAV